MKMKILPSLFAIALAFTSLSSCDESDDIGNSIFQDDVEIIVLEDYNVTGHTVTNAQVQSRTTNQLLGSIEANGFGNFSSDFVTQYMPAGQIDTTGVTTENLDTLRLMFAVPNDGYVGDSITPMGLKIHRLKKQLPSPIYSDFDPKDYYDPEPIATQIYTCSTLGLPDSLSKYKYHFVYCDLPISLGKELFAAYKANPSSYLEPSTFAKIFPGFYVTNSFGSGRVIKIEGNTMSLHYHKVVKDETTGNDSIVKYVGNYYSVTPEIITNNNISFNMSSSLKQMAQDGKTLIVAPAGMDVEISFPIEKLIADYKLSQDYLAVVNSLNLDIPVSEIKNDYGIAPPPNLLMVLSTRKNEFFDNNEVTDNKYSFYAAYDAVNKRYRFSGLRDYLLAMLEKDEITPEDYTFTLTPVNITTENYSSSSSSLYVSAIVPYIDKPAMAELKINDAKITFTYSKQSIKM